MIPQNELASMGCRTKVVGSVFPESDGIVVGRGNLSFTTINLVKLAIKCVLDKSLNFKDELKKVMDLAKEQLLYRFTIQCNKNVSNFPFLLGENIWMDTDKIDGTNYTTKFRKLYSLPVSEGEFYTLEQIKQDETIRNKTLFNCLKHGTLSIGFIGLAETINILRSDSSEATFKYIEHFEEAYSIVKFMRDVVDNYSAVNHLNFTLFATPAEGLCGRFVKIDRETFKDVADDIIKNILDKEYYTNSFHVPVYEKVTIAEKINFEAPFHKLTNAGAITYVELDGDPLKNLTAFEEIVKMMHDKKISYGAINHPLDKCEKCNFQGIINKNKCPVCGANEENIERIRRITGYLVGSLSKWNKAKQQEERDRVPHT
jgi:ribonucleoside-triphosphate reductase